MKKQETGIMNSQQAQQASAKATISNLARKSVVALLVTLSTNCIAQNTSINSNTVTISGTDNASYGPGSLNNTNTGTANAGYGKNSLNALSDGTYNSAFGVNALKSLSGGDYNVGIGYNVSVTDKNTVVLDQNVPNPFAESTTISYRTPENFSKAQMVITTIEGKLIKTIDITNKGEGRINIFASDLSSGIYIYSLIVDGKTMETKKLVKE